ncbi:MAG: hypothetical protein IT436_12405 [Phycisphaerales bacterium]|nr:hypothetical protein [Phycisphaerales bacterium]
MRHLLLCSAAALFLPLSSAHADVFRFQLARPESSLQSITRFSADFEGAMIGDYDPDTNPAGTQTRPGLFGGSGNQPIPTSLSAGADAQNTTHPAGSFTLDIDTGAGTVLITALDADLLAGAAPDVPLTITFEFDTFRTFSPSSLYIGGFPLTIPFGQATVSALSARLPGQPGFGILSQTGPDTYSFTILAALELSFEASLLGQPIAPPPTVIPVPLSGDLILSGDSATATLTFDFGIQQVIPGPLPGGAGDITDFPLDLPTILPPGQTAHLLLSMSFQQFAIDSSFTATLIADGAADCLADFNGDGFVDFADYLEFLNLYDSQDPAADLNGDGFIDFIDYLEFLNLYEAGC